MPYWSSSKVGADPQGQPSTKQQQKKRFSKGRKGITMEDLKKQTALRLAQEQKKSGKKSVTASDQQNIVLPPPQTTIPTRVLPIAQDLYQGNGNTPVLSLGRSIHDNLSPYITQRSDSGRNHPSYHHGMDTYTITPVLDQHFHNNPGTNEYDMLAPPSLSTSASSFDSSHLHGNGAQKSKLPHGLTVQELKEMTKARLQAESSERPAEEHLVCRPSNFDTNSPGPTAYHSSHEYHDLYVSRQKSQTSPAPSSYVNARPLMTLVRTNDTRETWDTASVGTATSDYPGSESVYSELHGAEDHAFSRSGSYPTGSSGQEYDWQASDVGIQPPSYVLTATSSYYDGNGFNPGNGFAPNRRRAATLSPRPVGLSHLHEDRPLLGGPLPLIQPIPTSQSMIPCRQRQGIGRTRNSSSCESPNYGIPSSHTRSTEVNNNTFEDNRARTSSTVSLPSGPFFTDESLGETGGFNCSNQTRFSNQFTIVQEDIPSTSVTGLSSVFRVPPDTIRLNGSFEDHFRDSAVSSLGLGSSSGNLLNTSSDQPLRKRAETDLFQAAMAGFRGNDEFIRAPGSVDARLRAATWGEPSLDMFGFSMFGTERSDKMEDDRLADDLATILKLSGSEQSDTLFAVPPGF